jgi:hypothetical protein
MSEFYVPAWVVAAKSSETETPIMISFEQAGRIARDVFARGGWGPDYVLAEDYTVVKPYGWEFNVRLKNPKEVRIGGCPGFIVESEDGAVFYLNTSPSSIFEVEQEVRAYQAGFKSKWYDLVIHKVLDTVRTVEMILSFDLRYVEPEEAHGRVWKIPKRYTREVLLSCLQRLPCEFAVQWPAAAQEVSRRLEEAGCCVFELRAHPAITKV